MRHKKQIHLLICSAVLALLGISACKKGLTAETESTTSGVAVSAFVTREHGYIDTAIGRKHLVSMAARIGIKRLYVNMWSRGCTLFKSNVMKQYGGPERCAEAEGDPLEDFVRYGKAFNVEIVPWFEWGNIVPARSALWQKNKNGNWFGFEENFHTVPSIRINPYKGSFEAFMSNLLKEVATKYGSREIHICDNFAPHLSSGAAAATLKGPQTFTAFMSRVTAPARTAGVRFSLSSQRQVLSLQNFSIDWNTWLKRGIVKWVYPQLYHVAEGKTDQFMSEARSERGSGAVGLALYSGPNTGKWSLEGLGRTVKMAKSVGMEPALFDLNTLLKDQGAYNNTHVSLIAAALGTPKRMDLGGSDPQMAPPPAPVLPPPAPVLPPPETQPDTQPSSKEKDATPKPAKTKLCEYMKVAGTPQGGAPTYASASKGPIIEYVGNDQLIYRYLTQIGVDGDQMMYVRIQTGAAQDKIRWIQAKYLVERDPNAEVCEP
ncbi:MAG: hypothetical protein FJY29_11160 [Betaproteobacteria bacterium]|nr:hypothetical protein [Betaproteobacteria bacterium]